jgi:hypothetical protein
VGRRDALLKASESFERQVLKRQRVLNEVKKLVDGALDSLHNLVSLLQTQQRRTRRWLDRWCEVRGSIFKNLQPISVGA